MYLFDVTLIFTDPPFCDFAFLLCGDASAFPPFPYPFRKILSAHQPINPSTNQISSHSIPSHTHPISPFPDLFLQPPSTHTSQKTNLTNTIPPFSPNKQILPHIPPTETSALCKRMLALQTQCVRTGTDGKDKPYILSVRGGANCSVEEDVKVPYIFPPSFPLSPFFRKRDGEAEGEMLRAEMVWDTM